MCFEQNLENESLKIPNIFKKQMSSLAIKIPRIFYYLGCLTIAQMIFRPAFSTTLSDYLFFISLIFALINITIKSEEIKYNIPNGLTIGVYLFLINLFLTLLFVDDSHLVKFSTIVAVKFLYLILIWFWLSMNILRTPSQVKFALICFGISCAISAVYGVFENPQYLWQRPKGMADHVNQFGATCGMGTILGFSYLWNTIRDFTKQNKTQLLVFLFIFISCLAGLYVSESLGSLLAVGVALLVWTILKGARLKKIIVVSLGILACWIFLLHQAQYNKYSIAQRFKRETNLNNRNATLTSRLLTYRVALERIFHNPLIGEGIGKKLNETGYEVHNIFLKVLFECGFIAMFGFVLILYSSFKHLIFLFNNSQSTEEKQLSIALLLCFIVYFVICLKEPIFYNRFGWLPIALALALNDILATKEAHLHARQPNISSSEISFF
ncbi:O-antigen polymerase [Dissulfuribacter thermophilus]|uniref:O-antigen polymerase n=1 Tax=Dissulfuribacter thermophilus TaxID=1156395 RepID=A0A1B9F6N7_9BACT|nr:O-antigen ligase family protein [Dissulfuribacter thermophilus]OCC15618.1 O-antigen polymerase [Dissulfuribacter thermophilus]